MSKYPLIAEVRKLETEILAESVKLGVLKYRVKEETRRQEQMEEIERN